MAGRAATTTIGITADVASATVRGSGKVASAVIGAGGDVADEGLRTSARLSKTGTVVFFDPKTGAIWEIPATKGLNLLAAAQAAQVDPALSALRIIRRGSAISAVRKVDKLVVKPGDVVELARRG